MVIISEYTGGGFGSKGSSSVFTAVAALLSKKANAPVMMRITRDEEHHIGRVRPALHSRVKIGFRKDGRITALDGLIVVDNGPYDVVSDRCAPVTDDKILMALEAGRPMHEALTANV